jgi:hypothetical protein
MLRIVGIVIARSEATRSRRARYVPLDCFASFATTIVVTPKCNLLVEPTTESRHGGA